MTEEARQERNRARLTECHPVFRARGQAVISELEMIDLRPRCQDAWRSPVEQRRKYEAKLSKLAWGFHCATAPDGTKEALAVDLVDDDDCADDGQPNLSNGLAYAFALWRACRRHHLATGITWVAARRIREGLVAAMEANDLTWPRKDIGWDPMHVEIADLTVSAARKGARPTAP